jgi:hypothetical protein
VTEQEHIAALAYKFYEEEGRPEGKADEHWAKAERAVREQRMPAPDAEREVPSAEALEQPKEVVPH